MKNTQKSIRNLSAFLALALVLGLLSAFPAIAWAESVNLALDGTYMYTVQSAVHSRSIDGDRTTTYGTGILNNGQKPDYDHNNADLRSQFSYVQRTGLTAAGFEITFDLGAVATLESVTVTGYHYTSTFGITPSTTDAAIHILACDTVDGEYTALGSTAITAMGSTAQAYTADITAAGSGRYVKIVMDNPAQYLLFSEVEIMGTKSAGDDTVSSEDVTSEDSSEETNDDFYIVAGDEGLCGAAWDPAVMENMLVYDESTGNYYKTYTDVPAGEYKFKVTTNAMWGEGEYNLEGDATSDGSDAVAVVEQDGATVTIGFDGEKALLEISYPGDEPPVDEPPVEDDVVTKNIAGNATYRGTDNANGTSNYGEADWNIYHAGKLNDGVIPEGDSESTKGQNVEIYIAGFVAGTVYVYFDLGAEEAVAEVVTYTNERLSSTNRGYPSKFNVYVGNSETLSEAALLGAATTTDEGAVRKYTASGDALTGRYVIFELGISSPDIVIALSEVEIYAVQEPVNHAPNSQYKGEGDDNGTSGSYCEVGAEWNEYHAGKLNDGTIATDASNNQTGVSVEFFNAGYAVGTNTLTFKFDYEVDVTEVIAHFNTRTNSANRGYPASVLVYVGNSEDLTAATLLGEATTTDEGYVRAYKATGRAKGTYVIFQMEIASPVAVIALTEVEIMGYGDAPSAPEIPKLESPVLSSDGLKFTYTIPTITWEAVENAVGYDVYLDGTLVLENTTELTYTPDVATRTDYNASNAYKVTVVAKTGGEEYADSLPSEAVEFIYVDMPTDIDGNPTPTADFIIDAGHGGTDPGALGTDGTREEADDNLNMALEVGKRLTALGFTVAYTRTTDVYDTVLTKAAKGEAGSFGYYLCFHRNSFSDERATGVETLYKPNDSGSNKALAQLVQDEIMALGVFTNRGIKERTDLAVLNNVTSMPVILMELSFISSSADNEKFDTYFNDIATAVVKGVLANAGYKTGFEGAVIANENDYTINDEAIEIHLDLNNYEEENSVLDLMFGIANGLGIKDVSVSVNGGEWTTIAPEDRIIIYGSEDYKCSEAIYAYLKDFLGEEEGHYTIKFKMTHLLEAGVLYTGETEFLTVNINLAAEIPVGFRIGDVNQDGEVDNLDATLMLQYDAALIDETGLVHHNGDVNHDGLVDNLDACLVLKFAAGLDDGVE